MTTGTRSTFQRAIDKAAELGTHKTVRQVSAGRYEVGGSHGRVYEVTACADGFTCTCTAGRLERPCYHQAAVWLRQLAEQAAGIAPAAPRESDADMRVRLLAESRERARTITELEGSLADCFTTAA